MCYVITLVSFFKSESDKTHLRNCMNFLVPALIRSSSKILISMRLSRFLSAKLISRFVSKYRKIRDKSLRPNYTSGNRHSSVLISYVQKVLSLIGVASACVELLLSELLTLCICDQYFLLTYLSDTIWFNLTPSSNILLKIINNL